MVLYTPLEYHDIFKETENDYQWGVYKGRLVQLRKDETGGLRLVQLYSTNPDDYLQTNFSPGAKLPNEIDYDTP